MWVNHSLLTIRYTLFIRCGAQRYHSSRSAGQRAQACALRDDCVESIQPSQQLQQQQTVATHSRA